MTINNLNKRPLLVLIALVLLAGWCCRGGNKTTHTPNQKSFSLPYQLQEPSQTFKLPNKLVEISGLSVINETKLACIQDEKANIYVYDLAAKKVVQKIDFGKNNDYEGIAVVDSTAYILRYDGNIYEIQHFLKDSLKTQVKHKSWLSKEFDTEGLCLDPTKNRLLIACKGKGKNKHKKRGKRDIFAFDLKKKTFTTGAVYSISWEAVQAYFEGQEELTLLEQYRLSSGRDTPFNPSGIAVHPITNEVYVLSGFTRMLAVLSPMSGKLLHVELLAPRLFPQPEGLSFFPNGNLLISSEGNGSKGVIHLFSTK